MVWVEEVGAAEEVQETLDGEETEVLDLEGKRYRMPRGDRSGPDGRGPRGGVCIGAGQNRGFGYGRGRGFGRGAGIGMGFGRGYAGANPVQVSDQDVLESRTEELERELAILKSRLEQSSEKSEN